MMSEIIKNKAEAKSLSAQYKESTLWLQRICYSHWANRAQNGVISIGQWGVFNHEKGAI